MGRCAGASQGTGMQELPAQYWLTAELTALHKCAPGAVKEVSPLSSGSARVEIELHFFDTTTAETRPVTLIALVPMGYPVVRPVFSVVDRHGIVPKSYLKQLMRCINESLVSCGAGPALIFVVQRCAALLTSCGSASPVLYPVVFRSQVVAPTPVPSGSTAMPKTTCAIMLSQPPMQPPGTFHQQPIVFLPIYQGVPLGSSGANFGTSQILYGNCQDDIGVPRRQHVDDGNTSSTTMDDDDNTSMTASTIFGRTVSELGPCYGGAAPVSGEVDADAHADTQARLETGYESPTPNIAQFLSPGNSPLSTRLSERRSNSIVYDDSSSSDSQSDSSDSDNNEIQGVEKQFIANISHHLRNRSKKVSKARLSKQLRAVPPMP